MSTEVPPTSISVPTIEQHLTTALSHSSTKVDAIECGSTTTSAMNSLSSAQTLAARKAIDTASHGTTTQCASKTTVVMRRPTTRSRRKALELTTSNSQVASKPLRLSQGNGSLETYLLNSSSIFSTLPNSGPQFQIDFVALFVKGIRDSKAREKLVNELQLIHPSKMKKDGKMEILCEWDDVSDALRSARLIEMGDKEGEQAPRRKRNILVPKESIEGAFMR